ncbi:MAG: hypothetical protein NUV84_02170 [Candidatus Uhrbacteria bacterium]|nr:hypothetical protein [Candidatus Uhrbacteria bacterium]
MSEEEVQLESAAEDIGEENVPEGAIDVGAELLSWEAWEFPPVERSQRWYIIASLLGVGLLLYAVFTANFVFGLIVLMFAVITIMKDLKKPARVPVFVTTAGIALGNEFYPYQDIRDFSISFDPPTVKSLYITFHGRTQPMLSIDLDDMNPNEVRRTLLPYVYENLEREGESLTDVLRRVYKL